MIDSAKFPVSSISAIADMSIVLSFVVFRKKIKTKKVMELFLYIFVSHLMTNIASIVELLSAHEEEAARLRLVSCVFSLAAIVWTVLVLLLLYSNVAFTKPIKISAVHHLFCWGIPVLCSTLPLVSGSSKVVWTAVSYYVVIYSCVLATAIISLQFFFHLQNVPLTATATKLKSIFNVVVAYPAVYFVCWFPSTVVDFLNITHPESPLPPIAASVTTGLACSTGFWSAVIFWLSNEHARNMWHTALFGASQNHQSSALSTRTTGNVNTVRTKPVEISIKIAEQDMNSLSIVRRFSGLAMDSLAFKKRPSLLEGLKYLSGINVKGSEPVAVDTTDDSGRSGATTLSPFPGTGTGSGPGTGPRSFSSGTICGPSGMLATTATGAGTDAPQTLLGLLERAQLVVDSVPSTPSPRGSEDVPGPALSAGAKGLSSLSQGNDDAADGRFDLDIERGSIRPFLPATYGRHDSPDV
jgi:hypothetical protein